MLLRLRNRSLAAIRACRCRKPIPLASSSRTGTSDCRIIARGMRSRWSLTTKRLVVGSLLVAAVLLIWHAGDIVRPFVWAAILSYILLPVVGALERRFTL